jgi:hypothetical protein
LLALELGIQVEGGIITFDNDEDVKVFEEMEKGQNQSLAV